MRSHETAIRIDTGAHHSIDLEVDQARILLRSVPLGVAGGLATTVMLAWVLRAGLGAPAMRVWWTASVLVHGPLLAAWRIFRLRLDQPRQARRCLQTLRACFLALGGSWALLPTALASHTAFSRLLVSMILAAITGAGVAQIAADTWAALLYMLPPAMAATVPLFLSSNSTLRSMGPLGLLYFGFLLVAMLRIHASYVELSRMRSRASAQSLRDSLTGLPNRALLLERIDHAFSNFTRSRSDGALLFVDLDNFKVLNDTLGHAKGDELLQRVAERLSRNLRQGDTLARLGGDEFVLLAENLGRDIADVTVGIKAVAEKLRLELVGEPIALDGAVLTISASIGVALLSFVSRSGAGSPGDDLLKRADMAMYEAKAAGRNQVKCFDPSMQRLLTQRAMLESQLKDGLRFEQFQLAYQPIVDEAACVVGFEALVRWPHPERGLVAPSEFIPAAETSGQIIALGDWILRTACARLAAWEESAELRGMTLSVNISARQVHHPDFVSQVTGAIEHARANPARLKLELTESVFAHDLEGAAEKLRRLEQLGVHFSLDDFGTGYSSLAYLKRLPFHQIKIDQSFVRDLLEDANDAAIVRAVVMLGVSLGLEVVAEGVETPEQFHALRRIGCGRFQGYLFGRPAPAEEVLAQTRLVRRTPRMPIHMGLPDRGPAAVDAM